MHAPLTASGLALCAVLAIACVAAADPAAPATTTLFLHVNGIQDIPMSVQEPADGYSDDASFGSSPSLKCFAVGPAADQPLIGDFYTWYAYITTGAIEYGSEGPSSALDRGLLDNVTLLAPPVLHWYWSTGVAASRGLGVQPPVVVPHVVVRATMRAGEAISVDDVAYNAGRVLAEGESAPALLAGDASTGAEHLTIDGEDVYHFAIPLQVKDAFLPQEGLNLRVDTYLLSDGCPAQGTFMPNVLALHTSPQARPRLQLTSTLPGVAQVNPAVDGNVLLVAAGPLTAFGAYDVANVTMTLASEQGWTRSLPLLSGVLTGHPCNSPCQSPDRVVYAWTSADLQTPLPDGLYTVRLAFTNLDGSQAFSDEKTVRLGDVAGPHGLPVPTWLVVGSLAAAVLLRRRRPPTDRS